MPTLGPLSVPEPWDREVSTLGPLSVLSPGTGRCPHWPLSVPEPWDRAVLTLGPLSVPEPWDRVEDWPKGRLHVPVYSSCTELGSHAAVTLPEGPGNACCFLGCVAHPTAGQKTPAAYKEP